MHVPHLITAESVLPAARKVPIHICREDMERLREVVERHIDGPYAEAAELLEDELDRAEVAPRAELPPDVVTMNAKVRFEHEGSGDPKDVTIVYPKEANGSQSRVSVLAPVGMALLGLKAGDTIDWPLPGGKTGHLRVLRVEPAPAEAAAGASR